MQNTLDSTKRDFFNYLTSLGINPSSHKNYRSDLGHFHSWLAARLKAIGAFSESLSDAVAFINPGLATSYRSELMGAKIPGKTINRRLSTLRHLARFLTSSQLLDFNFMETIENVTTSKKPAVNSSSLVNEFRAHLEAEKASPNTIKNYLSDINQFLTWLESNQQSTINN